MQVAFASFDGPSRGRTLHVAKWLYSTVILLNPHGFLTNVKLTLT